MGALYLEVYWWYHIGVDSGVVCSTELGNFQSLRTWNRQQTISRLNQNTKHNTLIVIYKTMRILWIDTIKFPLFFISPNVIFYSCMWFLIGKWENNWVADVENVFFMSNVQISWKFIIYWITRCLYTWNNIKNSKALWLIRLLQVVLPPP